MFDPTDSEDEDSTSAQSPVSNDSSDESTPSASPVNPILAQYLNNQQALKAAQSKASENQLLAGLARAGGTLSSALARSQTPVDQTGFNALDKNAQAPVDQVMADQAAQGKDIQNQAAAINLQKETAENDPNSEQSKAFRNALGQFPAVKAAYGDDFDSLTAADKQSVFDIIKTKEQIDARKQEKQLSYANKAGQGQDKAYTDLTKSLENFRGNKAVATAESNKLSADNALAMLNGKDLDNLNPTQIRLFSDELAKIATGGVPGEHGVEAIMPDTLQGKIANIQSFLSNSPTGAKAGDFLRQNMAYLKDLRNISAQKVTDYRSNLIKGYKNRVKPEDYSEAQSTYGLGDGSSSPSPKTQTSPQSNKPKTVTQNGHTYTLNENTGQYE